MGEVEEIFRVRGSYIYDTPTGSSWVKVGVDIDGEVAGDQMVLGRLLVSSDGSKIAIGAFMNIVITLHGGI